MTSIRRRATVAALVCLSAMSLSQAAPLFQTVQLINDSAVALDPVPPPQTLTISKAGDYSVTLTDLQLPAALNSLSLAIVTPTQNLLTLAAAGSQSVTLAAGTYTVQVLARAASGAVGGSFGVQVTAAGSTSPTWQYSDSVGAYSPPPTTGQSVLSTKVTAPSAGSYTLTVTDLAFPASLSSMTAILLNDCGTTPGCTTAPVTPTPIAGPIISTPVTLAAGTYDLFIIATASSPELQGLYSVELAPTGGGAPLYNAAVPVGELPAPIALNFNTAGAASLALTDLQVPLPLSGVNAVITQAGSLLLHAQAVGANPFSAAAGAAELYLISAPSGSQGALEAVVTSGSQTVADVAVPVLQSGAFGFVYPVTVASAGNYQLSVHDFQKPDAFSTLAAVAVQGGALLTNTTGTGTFKAAAGPLNVLVFPALPSAPTPDGLFNVQLAAATSGVSLLQRTQGVGALFSSQTMHVAQAGTYQFALTDLAFPDKFSTLSVIMTQADSITGYGNLNVSLQPGDYVINVLAQVGSTADYGLYGIEVGPPPPVPTAKLTASPNPVTSGQTTTLTWSSTDATSCAASGGWSGPLPATSGTRVSGVLSAATTFTLECTGDGGTATVSAAVAVNPVAASAKSGGGGALGGDTITALLGLWLVRLWRRRLGYADTAPCRSVH
jgi:hypothetical protein